MTNSSLLGLIETGGKSLESQLNFSSAIQFGDFSAIGNDFTFPLIDNFTASVATLNFATFGFGAGQDTPAGQATIVSVPCTSKVYDGTTGSANNYRTCPSDANYNPSGPSQCYVKCQMALFYHNVSEWLPKVNTKTAALNSTYVNLRANVVGVNALINGPQQGSVRSTIKPLLDITNSVRISRTASHCYRLCLLVFSHQSTLISCSPF